jgi:hypothetical protein
MSNHEFATNNYLEVLVDDEAVDCVGPNMIFLWCKTTRKKVANGNGGTKNG